MNCLLRKKDLSSPMSEFLSTIVLVIVLLIGGTMVLSTKSEILAQEIKDLTEKLALMNKRISINKERKTVIQKDRKT